MGKIKVIYLDNQLSDNKVTAIFRNHKQGKLSTTKQESVSFGAQSQDGQQVGHTSDNN